MNNKDISHYKHSKHRCQMYNVLCFRKMIPANKYVINFHNLIMYHISSHLLSYYWFVYHDGYLLCDVYYIVGTSGKAIDYGRVSFKHIGSRIDYQQG